MQIAMIGALNNIWTLSPLPLIASVNVVYTTIAKLNYQQQYHRKLSLAPSVELQVPQRAAGLRV